MANNKKLKAKTKAREASRKDLAQIPVTDITAIDNFALIARYAHIVDISPIGLQLQITRENLIPRSLRTSMNIDEIIGEHIMISIDIMDLDIDGIITRTRYIGDNTFEIGVDYSQGSPEYWRECLVDLLPSPGEIDDV